MTQNRTEAAPEPGNGNRGRTILWLLATVEIIAVQWPTIKGWYYKAPPAQSAKAESAVAWRTDYAAAQAEAKETGKPILLDFTASWCPPCQLMKAEVWTDSEVGKAVHENTIPVLVDVDLPVNEELSRRYEIHQIPTILLTDAAGARLKQANYMSAEEVKRFVRQSL